MEKLLSAPFPFCLCRIVLIEALKPDIIVSFLFCMVTLSLIIVSLLTIEQSPESGATQP